MARKKKPKLTEQVPRAVQVPYATLFRMFVLGSIAVVAAVWALWRHYYVPRMPMRVPVPSASEIEIEP